MSTQPTKPAVDLEFTPNPSTLKYSIEGTFVEKGVFNYKDQAAAEGKSALALKLFGLAGVSAVMVAKTFVTVTLEEPDSLTELNESVISTIQDFILSGEAAVNIEAHKADSAKKEGENDAEQKIIQILEDEIRPAVAMDGGDITFERYEDGVLYLQMKGACAGCPSSTATLKMGIENRIREVLPDLKEVLAV